ncbi:DUF333 domain-containing protein [Shewanella schlegeliana]|uniref:DUF333 domain-containing protein n=1 Tax=Shewanella schlegeliana TaxID=190308 RepID=A0ABS1T391_9GAMM|nr:DUF333 domain-containing protein [Shewanella schlegeliana]MBL4915270.1 DUF333 domain-containing protein [Shewanella schlegeliana]MCL1111219.1 DUF333 domain-containing protein [Shewanella schlegeliana]
MKSPLIMSLVITTALLLSACNPKEPEPHLNQKDAATLANPASMFCISLGGDIVIENDESGLVGYCNLPNGKRVEEWTLYRSSTKQSLAKTKQQLTNPASENCIAQGGKVDLATSICTLANGEKVEQWILFRRDNKIAADSVGAPNPASEFCLAQQGQLNVATGMCTLPSGEQIEQWKLYRQNHQQAVETTYIPNPATEYCLSLNGEVDPMSGICTLPNGEKIEQWSLFSQHQKDSKSEAGILDAPNPAAEYCLSLEGKVDLATGICTLPSGEKVDQWALYHRDHKAID